MEIVYTRGPSNQHQVTPLDNLWMQGPIRFDTLYKSIEVHATVIGYLNHLNHFPILVLP
jgi:hypothetical protein